MTPKEDLFAILNAVHIAGSGSYLKKDRIPEVAKMRVGWVVSPIEHYIISVWPGNNPTNNDALKNVLDWLNEWNDSQEDSNYDNGGP